MITVVGIDPGLSGAVAVLHGREVHVYDTPTIRTGRGARRAYNLQEMSRILHEVCGQYNPSAIAVERQQAMPGQGVTSTFSTGYGYGLWCGMVAACGVPMHTPRPVDWHRAVLRGMAGEGKQRSMLAAMALFPGLCLTSPRGTKPTKDGRADAALIAEHVRRQLSGQE